MYKYVYVISDNNGWDLIHIKTASTLKTYNEYMKECILPLLPVIAESYGVEMAYVAYGEELL